MTLRLPDNLYEAIRTAAFDSRTHMAKLMLEQLEEKWLTSNANPTTENIKVVASVLHRSDSVTRKSAKKPKTTLRKLTEYNDETPQVKIHAKTTLGTCKNGHLTNQYGKCLAKGCKFGSNK